MKNWFYVYKNYSVNEDLKKILEEYYLTEVKTVERPDKEPEEEPMKEKQPVVGEQSKVKVPAGLQGKPTDHLINPDKQVRFIFNM